MATINQNGSLPVFNTPQEMLAYLQQNNMLPNQFNPSNNLDWATTNQLVQPNYQAGAYNVPNSYPPTPTVGNNFNNQFSPTTNSSVNSGLNEWNQAYLTGQGTPPTTQPTEVQQGLIDANYPETVETPVTNTNNQNYQAPFQFFNQYGGYDLPTATFRLGQSVEDGNTLGTVASGLKVASSLARNFLGGLSYNRRNQQLMEEYRNNQRQYLTQENNAVVMEDGGEMMQQPQNEEQQLLQEVATAVQQGEDPQVILQTLVEMGIDEQTAQGMIEFVMQQLQGQQQEPVPTEDVPVMEDGGTYMAQLKGKKILDYKLNTETGKYDVTYE